MSNIMKKLIINDGEFEIVDEAARNAIEEFNDKPFISYEEDSAAELPVHTINDNVTSADSTWSSSKIQNKLDSIDVDVTPEYTAALPTGTTVSNKKGDVEGGCYKVGKLVTVNIKITMTTTFNQLNQYTGTFAELGEGLVPAFGKAALSAFANTSAEKRYPLTCYANSTEVDNYAAVNIGSPNLKLTEGMEIYINGSYAVA